MRKWLASIVILALSFVAIGHAQRAAALDPEAGHRHKTDRGQWRGGSWMVGSSRRCQGANHRIEVQPDERRASRHDRAQHHLLGSATDGDGQLHRQSQLLCDQTAQSRGFLRPVHRWRKPRRRQTESSYFLIRENGQFLIKKRNGASTSNVAGDWAQPGNHGNCRRLPEERAVDSGFKRARQLHGQRQGSRESPCHRHRHQRRLRPSHWSRDGYSDRRVWCNAIDKDLNYCNDERAGCPSTVYVKKPIIISSHV